MLYDNSLENDTVEWKNYYKNRHKVFDIKNFTEDGFEKVCDVNSFKSKNEWVYLNINEDLMYSDHTSWVYFLVIDNSIVKCGETGNPLGIVSSRTSYLNEAQPITGSKSRFGRLRTQPGDTDEYLRESIRPYLAKGIEVSLWAKKCPIINKQITISGKTTTVATTMHKDLEMLYLAHFKDNAGCLPLFNKATK